MPQTPRSAKARKSRVTAYAEGVIRRFSPLAVVTAAVLALGLSACAPVEEKPATEPTPTGSASATPTPTPSATPSPSPTADLACLVGAWHMGQDQVTAFYNDVNSLMAGSGAKFTPVGTADLILRKDGTYKWTPAEQVTANVSGTTILINFKGSITGTYTVTGNGIGSQTQDTSGLEIVATIDGKGTDAGAISQQISVAPISDAKYGCKPDTLTLINKLSDSTATSVLHRE